MRCPSPGDTTLRLTALVVALLAAIVISGCARRQPAVKPPKPPAPTVVGKSSGVHSVMDDAQGRRLWEISAASSEQSQAKGTAVFRKATVKVYDKGVPAYRFTAPEVRATAEGRRVAISLTGGVNARETNGPTSFHVDRLTWVSDTRAFEGQGNIRYTQGPLVMTGQRLTGSIPVRFVNVSGDVHFSWKEGTEK